MSACFSSSVYPRVRSVAYGTRCAKLKLECSEFRKKYQKAANHNESYHWATLDIVSGWWQSTQTRYVKEYWVWCLSYVRCRAL